MAGSVLALALQTPSLAQSDLNLVNIDLDNGYRQTGAAGLGLPGDLWNYMSTSGYTVSSAIDALGNGTTVSVQLSGVSFPAADPTDTSPLTRGLLSDYAVQFSSMQMLLSGLVPDTNYVLVSYMTGNGNGQGGRITWSDGATFTNTAECLNNPLTTKSNFISGQNYCTIVVHSDASGNVGAGPDTLNITANTVQGWLQCWNGCQIQLAPDIPVTYGLPQPESLFPGRTAHFLTRSAGIPPLSFQWQQAGTNLADGGGISGSTNPVLTVAGVTASGTYSLIVGNTNGATTNSVALTVVSPTPGSYPAVANSDNPIAYWRLNENAGSTVAYEYINGLNGNVGSGVTLGVAGVPDPGFEATHNGARFVVNNTNSTITVPPLELNTNTVTITAWIKPNGAQNPGAALLLTRSGTGGAGLNYGPATDTLGYTWNNGSSSTYQWNSGLNVPENTWSFVALVIEPTKATLYVFNTGSMTAAINAVPNNNEAWNGNAQIGSDPSDTVGTNNFNGVMNELTVFPSALSSAQLYALYAAALQSAPAAPSIIKQPAAKAVSNGAIARFSVVAVGTGPLSYQWQEDGTNLTDGGQISGSSTPTLLVSNAGSNNAGHYDCVVTGSTGSPATSSMAALTISSRLLLFNLDFNAGGSPTASGAEVLGQAGDLWNGLNSASASGLPDYSGNPSTVGVTLTGASFSDDPNGGIPTTNTLMEDYAYDFGTMGVSVTGLNTNAAYTVVAYSAGDQAGQGGTFSAPLSGTTLVDYRDPLAEGENYVMNTNIIPDSSGRISFQIGYGTNGSSGPSVLNGLQVMQQDISAAVPIIGVQPVGGTNYSGFPVTFSVRAVSDTPITYQWMKDGTPLADGGNISGSAAATLTINPLNLGDGGTYTVKLSNANGSVTSAPATMTVLDGTYGWMWSAPVKVTTAPAVLLLPGQIVGAAAFGGQASPIVATVTNANNQPVQVAFTVDGSVATATGNGATGNGFTGNTGDTNLNAALDGFEYDGGPKTITLGNLTPGLRYSVQFFGIDDRGGEISTRQAYLQDPVVPTDVSQTWQMGDNVYVVGTITATNSTQTFIEQLPGDPGTGNNAGSGDANALVVRLAPPNVSIVNNGNGTVTVGWDQTLSGTGPAHLQSASSLTGPWTDQGTSSPVTVPLSGAQFFRAVLP